MTRLQQKITLCVAGAIVAAISFALAGNGWAARDDNPLSNWLKLDDATAAKVQSADATFADESKTLRQTLNAERQTLSQIMSDPASSEQQILSQVERVIAAHDALERRVAKHLVAVRSMLTPEQQKQLMSLCADAVTQGSQNRWRHGRDADATDSTGGQGQGRHGYGGGGGGGGGRHGGQ